MLSFCEFVSKYVFYVYICINYIYTHFEGVLWNYGASCFRSQILITVVLQYDLGFAKFSDSNCICILHYFAAVLRN